MKRLIIGVTGTPGSGKSYFAKGLSERIPGSVVVELNDIVFQHHAYSGWDQFGVALVVIEKLDKLVHKVLKSEKAKVIILVGHLAPELSVKYDIAVVTRAKLKTIMERLEGRKYPYDNIRDDLSAEAIDYCGVKMEKICKNTIEVQTLKDKRIAKRYLVALAAGKKAVMPSQQRVDNLNELITLVKKHNKYGL